jgi:hypothetical protein
MVEAQAAAQALQAFTEEEQVELSHRRAIFFSGVRAGLAMNAWHSQKGMQVGIFGDTLREALAEVDHFARLPEGEGVRRVLDLAAGYGLTDEVARLL